MIPAMSKLLLLAIVALPFSALHAAEIQGIVQLDPSLKASIQPTAALYITAKDPASGRGMPLAVVRVPQPIHFPVKFTLSEANAMIPGTKIEGKLAVSARLNQSGSAGPAQAGDIEPAEPLVVDAGSKMAKRVVIKLTKRK
jgi:hypothetical protein